MIIRYIIVILKLESFHTKRSNKNSTIVERIKIGVKYISHKFDNKSNILVSNNIP